jgi:hypothetical protein
MDASFPDFSSLLDDIPSVPKIKDISLKFFESVNLRTPCSCYRYLNFIPFFLFHRLPRLSRFRVHHHIPSFSHLHVNQTPTPFPPRSQPLLLFLPLPSSPYLLLLSPSFSSSSSPPSSSSSQHGMTSVPGPHCCSQISPRPTSSVTTTSCSRNAISGVGSYRERHQVRQHTAHNAQHTLHNTQQITHNSHQTTRSTQNTTHDTL